MCGWNMGVRKCTYLVRFRVRVGIGVRVRVRVSYDVENVVVWSERC